MVTEDAYDSSAGEADNSAARRPSWDDSPDIAAGERALVEEWLCRLKDAEDDPKWKNAFERSRKCMYVAANGADENWIKAGSFTVPIATRHINLAVAKLYARNPRVAVTRKRKLMFTAWDGKASSLQAAVANPLDPMSGVILQEIAAAQDYDRMATQLAKALEILWDHFTSEQKANFKLQMKAAVRRSKVCGAAYVRLGFQRALELDAEVTKRIADSTEQIKRIEAKLSAMAESDEGYDEESAALEELKKSMEVLQGQEAVVVREGPVFGFPKFDSVLVDPACVHLKTLAGAGWTAYRFDKTPMEGKATWGVDVKNNFTPRVDPKSKQAYGDKKKAKARFWEVWDITTGMVFVVCEGYPGYVQPPAAPKVALERFFDLFPLVFNEVESDDDLVPPSDIWNIRDPIAEYNRSRQGLREHRIANRPRYATPRGALEDEDKKNLTGAPAHSVIEVDGLTPREKINDKLQRIEFVNIDPNQYQVEESFKDILRAVGSQEANFGTTSGDTATEASIADASQNAAESDNRDDLDEMLSELAKSFGQLCIMELSKDTVVEICGPGGAVWPDMPPTREALVKDLVVEIKAGSSGRPNAQAELAKMERMAPYLMQLPGVNPEPIVKKAAMQMDMDPEELYIEGLPSITALNAAAGKPVGAQETGDPATDPNAQGGAGANNAPNPQQNEPGPQPQFPAGGEAVPQVA